MGETHRHGFRSRCDRIEPPAHEAAAVEQDHERTRAANAGGRVKANAKIAILAAERVLGNGDRGAGRTCGGARPRLHHGC